MALSIGTAPNGGKLLRHFVVNLFIPYKRTREQKDNKIAKTVSVIIPSYKPPKIILELIKSLLHERAVKNIVVVNDNTPPGWENVFEVVKSISRKNREKVYCVSTKENLKRAGAVNTGAFFLESKKELGKYILMIDDDACLDEKAIEEMVKQLESDTTLGAVCTQARVLNRHQNILTRLQGLEYVHFNISRTADDGFLQGPLIMHGLASMIRKEAFLDINGYTADHLIEDYDLTVRLKKRNWRVSLCPSAIAWTEVPDTLKGLWKQRIRWYLGGLRVIKDHYRYLPAILPDLISHIIHLILLALIVISFMWSDPLGSETETIHLIRWGSIILSIAFLAIQVWFISRYDKSKDALDIVIRVSILPELYYAILLSLVLWGSYAFFVYEEIKKLASVNIEKWSVIQRINQCFTYLGFTNNWGTK